MINIISQSLFSNKRSGPQQVALNFIKGLDILGYPYCINQSLDATSQLWIHDDGYALREAAGLKLKAVVGPNLYEFPRHIPASLDMSNFVYIHPSKSVTDFWKYLGFDRCVLDYWPVGIDTEEFKERQKPEDGLVLIHFKYRDPEELAFAEGKLKELQIRYEVMICGSYKIEDYIEKLKYVKYIIWIGRYESQGLAFEESLAMNVPILVWDILRYGHYGSKLWRGRYKENELNYDVGVTSACYFDETCGMLIKNKEDLEKSLLKMEERWPSFNPRKYILENLSLEKQANDLIELFKKHFNISYESGKVESLRSNKKWEGDTRFYAGIFNFIKKVIVNNQILYLCYRYMAGK